MGVTAITVIDVIVHPPTKARQNRAKFRASDTDVCLEMSRFASLPWASSRQFPCWRAWDSEFESHLTHHSSSIRDIRKVRRVSELRQFKVERIDLLALHTEHSSQLFAVTEKGTGLRS